MKIVVMNGSPHANGNTSALVDAFKKGAESKGNEVVVCPVGTMQINGCKACEYCHTAGEGKCIQQDDMQAVSAELADADMVVLASPVHYWGFSGQLQCAVARFYATGKPAKATKYAMILSSGSPGVYDAIISQYKSIVRYFDAEDLGICAFDGDAKTEERMTQVEAFGASL